MQGLEPPAGGAQWCRLCGSGDTLPAVQPNGTTPVFTRRDADTLQGDSGLNAHGSYVGDNQNLQTSQLSANSWQKDPETGSAVPRDTAAVMPLKTIAPSDYTKGFILCDSLHIKD